VWLSWEATAALSRAPAKFAGPLLGALERGGYNRLMYARLPAGESFWRRHMNLAPWRATGTWRWTAVAILAALAVAGGGPAQERAPRFRVTVKDERPVVIEPEVPLDPQRRINYQSNGLAVTVQTEAGQTLHLSHYPTLSIDGQLSQQFQPMAGGRAEFVNRPLGKTKGGKQREGVETCYVFGDVRVTCTVTVSPTKPATRGAKRRRDAVLIHYLAENKGRQPHKFGLRVYMDVYVINNDGALFAAPTMPGKVLDAVVLKEKLLPPYVQLLQVPDLKNPGFVAHLTLDLGSRLEKPDRVVLTRHGVGFGGWDMQAVNAGGDSALGIFWEPKELKPGAKREIAYGYGQGIVTSPENEGRVQLALGGSFEPGKLCDVTAYVTDPAPGQTLTLELPEGMALVEGKECQPVPDVREDEATSLVRWRARVLRPGEFPLRVRSSAGTTEGKTISVTPVGG
jgi:hypothetical protein